MAITGAEEVEENILIGVFLIDDANCSLSCNIMLNFISLYLEKNESALLPCAYLLYCCL